MSLGHLLTVATLFASSLALPAHSLPQVTHTLPPNSTASSIIWGACPTELPGASSLQCASFSVPVDWDQPYGEHIDLGLVRLPAAAGNSTLGKVGYLFLNPGGPGGSATQFVGAVALGAIQDQALLDGFDIIGLDPRGVGLSNQVQCDPKVYAERVSLFPQNEEELNKLQDKNRRLGKTCLEATGSVLNHLDTTRRVIKRKHFNPVRRLTNVSVAKDHEAVRIALGNEPINFVGLSYGSQLGFQYAALFPDNIRTLALDGVLQHSQSEAANLLIEATSYDLGLSHFFEWAHENSTELKGLDVETLWFELLVNASTTPIPAPLCNNTDCYSNVTAEDIRFNAHKYLTFTKDLGLGSSWNTLATALYNASQGDASALSTPLTDPSAWSFLAIGCSDWTHKASSTLPEILAQQTMAKEYAKLTTGASQMWQLQHGCLEWPVTTENPPKKLAIQTKTPILLTQSTSDPSTGLPWALGMLEEIDNKVLVLRKGDGHTSLPLGGKTAETIIEYLITGKVPKPGLVLDS